MLSNDPSIDTGWLVDDPEHDLSWFSDDARFQESFRGMRQYVYMQMIAADLPLETSTRSSVGLPEGLLANLQEKNRLLSQLRAPIDQRIDDFLRRNFADLNLAEPLLLPLRSLVLDRHGMARELSLPDDADHYENELLSSYRAANGVLHNPRFDRRTTKGTFHVAEGGLPIPGDKQAVPKATFAKLMAAALRPPRSLLQLPLTKNSSAPAETFVSLLLRPLVCPAVPGYCRHKSMEIRFFAPGALVSNLDFVESIFGNAGDPLIPENDSGLDVLHWSGHTGCVILAPHLTQLTKKDLGLPHFDQATERQRLDGMCWKSAEEKYNDGQAFKCTFRTSEGTIITLIADNYFGYCKKEVKTQISFAANLMGNVEEEHAGGALAFASFSLGDEFQFDSQRYNGRTFANVASDYSEFIEVMPEGYGIDRNFPQVIYVPENAKASLHDQAIRWNRNGQNHSIPIEPDHFYIGPSGYKLHMEKHPAAPSWRLIGTAGEGMICHKPCTVSGGGKSEISKSLRDYKISGPIFVSDIDEDFALIEQLFSRDYSDRWRAESTEKPDYASRPSRSVLDPKRSLGSVIKLLTPSRDYTDEYNRWLAAIPSHIYAMAFIIKRFCKPEWNGQWQSHFSVDVVNGEPGHELKYMNRKLVGMYLRVGLDRNGRWRTYKLRQDFAAAIKVQLEDDITASVVVPGRFLETLPSVDLTKSYKFVVNCEYRLFQRPDDAVHRGLDRQTELDMSKDGNFFCNFQPLTQNDIRREKANVTIFDQYSEPMRKRLESFSNSDDSFVVSSACPRIVDGAPSKNPRYLQNRPDLISPLQRYVAWRGIQLFRATGDGQPVPVPVAAVLSGRRNNPPEPENRIRSLAVYNPIHYQELPELLMDYVCSLTGKSPSTTGAGSEGALTKGPFNALLPIYDLNAMFVDLVLTDLGGFSTAAGHVGAEFEVGHDISMLVPEIWCRLGAEERDPKFLIREGMLEPLVDFEHQGKLILASRLGYRITRRFVRRFFGRVFDNPEKVFDDRILKPETQDLDSFADGICYIVEAQQRVASTYFEDGSVEAACLPLQALLEIMAKGTWKGLTAQSPEFRAMFHKENVLASDWYRQRLAAKQSADIGLWKRHIDYLKDYMTRATHRTVIDRLKLSERLAEAESRHSFCHTEQYLQRIEGTLGLQPDLVAKK